MRVCLDLDAVASHRTGTALHRVGRFELMRPLEVVVRHDRQTARHPEATVHTSTWLPSDDIVTVHGIPTLGVARSLMSLAALPAVSDEALRGAVDEAVRDRKATDRWLCWRLEQVRCRGRNGVIRFEEVLTRRAGGEKTESWLEREFLRVLETAGVPLPVCQRRIRKRGIFLARVDFAFPGTNVVIEVSGNEHHATAAQRIQDAQRRNRLLLEGFQVLEFTYEDVVENPALVIATVRRALYDARAA